MPAPALHPLLPLFRAATGDANVAWMLRQLREHAGWLTSTELLRRAGRPDTDTNRRWLRALANASAGEIFSGPGSPGYKATTAMTHEEYQHYRNAVLSQCEEMRARILRTDQVFYRRTPAD